MISHKRKEGPTTYGRNIWQFIYRQGKVALLAYQEKFEAKIIEASKRTKKGANKNTQELKVDPVLHPDEEYWFDRSLEADGLLINSQQERCRMTIVVDGTCSPDSFLQMLAWQYIDDVRIRNIIDELIRTTPDSDLARFIAILVHRGGTKEVYRRRMELLSKICYVLSKENFKFVQCLSSNYHIIEELVSPLFQTMISTCECRYKKRFHTIPIDYRALRSYRLPALQQLIDQRIKDGEQICCRCGQKNTITYAFSQIVFIIVAPYEAFLHRVNGWREVPQTIMLNDQTYDLTCFTDLIHSSHTTINCRRNGNEWYHYDDNTDKAEILPSEVQMDVETLMYKRRVFWLLFSLRSSFFFKNRQLRMDASSSGSPLMFECFSFILFMLIIG